MIIIIAKFYEILLFFPSSSSFIIIIIRKFQIKQKQKKIDNIQHDCQPKNDDDDDDGFYSNLETNNCAKKTLMTMGQKKMPESSSKDS